MYGQQLGAVVNQRATAVPKKQASTADILCNWARDHPRYSTLAPVLV